MSAYLVTWKSQQCCGAGLIHCRIVKSFTWILSTALQWDRPAHCYLLPPLMLGLYQGSNGSFVHWAFRMRHWHLWINLLLLRSLVCQKRNSQLFCGTVQRFLSCTCSGRNPNFCICTSLQMEEEENGEGQLYCLTFLFRTAVFQNEKILKVHWRKRPLGYKTKSQDMGIALSSTTSLWDCV